MAACESCGQKAGFGKKQCEACLAKAEELRQKELQATRARQQAEASERANAERERKAKAEQERQRRLQEFTETRLKDLDDLLTQGVTPYLYDVLHINAKSYFNESPNPRAWSFKTETGQIGADPDVTELQALGWMGWEVVGIIPITFGSTLYNEVGGNTVNAAAYGGLVVGAQVLVRLPITKGSLDSRRDYISSLIQHEFPG